MPNGIQRTVDVVESLRERVEVGSPEISNISIEFEVQAISEDDFCELIAAISENPSLFSSVDIDLMGIHSVASLRGNQVETGNIEEIEELGLSASARECERKFTGHRDDGSYQEAAKAIYDFAVSVSDTDDEQLVTRVIVDKHEMAEQILKTVVPDSEISDYNALFWFDTDRFEGWLEDNSSREIVENLFRLKRFPILLFGDDVQQRIDTVVISSSNGFQDIPVHELEEQKSRYIDFGQTARKVTQWRDSLLPLYPKQVLPLYEAEFNGCARLIIISILGVFAKEVEDIDGDLRFTYTLNPEYRPKADVDSAFVNIETTEVAPLIEMYREFEVHEDDASFRDLWQRAIASECNEKPLEDILTSVEGIRGQFEDFREAAVSANFDDLSDVLDDTQSLMADITSRLSGAANDVSRQIQGLAFTLLGTIIANIFLVLRWGSKDLVPPFSIFVLTIIVGFYLPLVQGRIEDLNNTIEEIENDFDFYQKQIRRFNQNLFDSNLDGRMKAHRELAERQRDRANEQLELIFMISMVVWAALNLWTGVAYGMGLLRTGSLLISVVVLAAILTERFGHREHEYFSIRLVGFVLVIAVFSLGLQVWIAASPVGVQNTIPHLPRFQSDNSTSAMYAIHIVNL